MSTESENLLRLKQILYAKFKHFINDKKTRSAIRKEIALHFKTLDVICNDENNSFNHENSIFICLNGITYIYFRSERFSINTYLRIYDGPQI